MASYDGGWVMYSNQYPDHIVAIFLVPLSQVFMFGVCCSGMMIEHNTLALIGVVGDILTMATEFISGGGACCFQLFIGLILLALFSFAMLCLLG